MANFAAPGFSSGFSRGAAAAQGAQSIKLQKEQLRSAQLEQAREQMQKAYDSSESTADSHLETYLELIEKAAPTASPEQMQELQNFALLGAQRHADFVRDYMVAPAIAAGASPEELALLPDPDQYMEMKRQVVDAASEVARLIGQTPKPAGDFFAQVDGYEGSVRVTSQNDAGGNTKYFVGDKEVPAASVGQPVQETRELSNLQIPGLTPGQSGEVIGQLRESGAANNAFATIANRVVRQVQGQPEKVGVVGDILKSLDVVTSQAEAVANVFGVGQRYESDLDSYDWRSLANESQEVKTRLLDLVFLNLAAKGQTGRAVSDRDLEIFMDATGFGTGSPGRIASGLQSAVEDNRIGLEEQIRTKGGGALQVSDILPGGFVEFSAPGQADMAKANALLQQANDAAAKGDMEEATRILDELDKLTSNGGQ